MRPCAVFNHLFGVFAVALASASSVAERAPFGFLLSPREQSQVASSPFTVQPTLANRRLLASALSPPLRRHPRTHIPVLPKVGTTRLTSDDPKINFHPADGWQRVRGPDFLSGTVRRSRANSTLARFSLSFVGTGVEWIGSRSPHHGQAEVWLDGQVVQIVDSYSPRWVDRRVLASMTDLEPGSHKIVVVQLNTKQRRSRGDTIDVDALVVMNQNHRAPRKMVPISLASRRTGIKAFDVRAGLVKAGAAGKAGREQ